MGIELNTLLIQASQVEDMGGNQSVLVGSPIIFITEEFITIKSTWPHEVWSIYKKFLEVLIN